MNREQQFWSQQSEKQHTNIYTNNNKMSLTLKTANEICK